MIFQITQQNWFKKYNTYWYFQFCTKNNLASLKTEVDQLEIDELAPVPIDLSKLSDVVKNHVVKKAAYDKLGAKVNNVDTSDLVLKNKYQINKAELEKKIRDGTNFLKKGETHQIRKQNSKC